MKKKFDKFQVIYRLPIFFIGLFIYFIFKKNLSIVHKQIIYLNYFYDGDLTKIPFARFFFNSQIETGSISELINKGYMIEEKFLEKDEIIQIYKFISEKINKIKFNKIEDFHLKLSENLKLINNNKITIENEQLINEDIFKDIIKKKYVKDILDKYFGNKKKIIDVLSLSITQNVNSKTIEDSAQMYHYDMDRLNWVKFFIYLTDVEKDHGPHQFIENTHKPGEISSKILSYGYKRLDEEEINNIYDNKLIKTFTGKSGKLIVENTKGLHRGKLPKKDFYRIMLTISFTTSRFGSPMNKIPINNLDQNFKKYLNENRIEFF